MLSRMKKRGEDTMEKKGEQYIDAAGDAFCIPCIFMPTAAVRAQKNLV